MPATINWNSENASGYPPMLQKLSSIVLQHLYAGYQFNRFELYLSGRNILRGGQTPAVTGDIAYYGAGVTAKF